MERKFRFVFDRKGCEVANTDDVFDAITRGMRDWAAIATSQIDPEPPRLRRRDRAVLLSLRLAEAAGTLLAYLIGLAILAGLLGAFAAAARFGWESVG